MDKGGETWHFLKRNATRPNPKGETSTCFRTGGEIKIKKRKSRGGDARGTPLRLSMFRIRQNADETGRLARKSKEGGRGNRGAKFNQVGCGRLLSSR